MRKTRKNVSDNKEFTGDLGRLQPQAREIECAVLGALMLDSEAYTTVSGILTPEMFYDRANEVVFRAIQALSESKRPLTC
jgi:replicative DNA helicase